MKRSIFTFVLLFLGLTMFGQSVVFQENFETPPLGVTSSSTGSGVWALNTRIYSQGLHSDSSVVTTNDTTYLTTDSFSTLGNHSVILQFNQICKIEFFDKGFIQYSTDNGLTYQNIDGALYQDSGVFSTSGNRFSGASYVGWDYQHPAILTNSMWRSEHFDISSLVGDKANVRIRFALVDGNGNGAAGYQGWFLDSITVTESVSELIPPTITLLTPIMQDTAYTSGPFNVGASISDASGIDTAYCVYTVNPGNIMGTIPMIYNASTIDSFYCNIPFYGYGRSISYYVKAVDGSFSHNMDSTATKSFFCKYRNSGNFTIGTGTDQNSTTGYPCVFGQYYTGDKTQLLIHASELTSQGVGAGNITSIAFDVVSTNAATSAGHNHDGFTIMLKNTNVNDLTSNFENNLTQVYTVSSYQTVTGWNTFTFSTPFYWDGVSNIVVQTCYDNYVSGSSYSHNAVVNRTATSFTSAIDYHDDGGGVCANSSGNTSSLRPNMLLSIDVPSTLTNDIGVYSILNPNTGVLIGSAYDIDVNIKNYGIDTVTTAYVNWTFDGLSQTPYHYTDSIKSDSITPAITLATKTATAGSHYIKAWTDSVNGVSDFNIANDTASFSFYGCSSILSGTYTIGGSSADFPTFADAALALNQCGINGPVVFNVAPGVYNEHFELMPVNGSSPTNTITFQSANMDSSAVTLAFDATGNVDNYVVKLNGTAYITFQNMTFEAQDITYARAFYLVDGVHDFSLLHNVIKTTNGATLDDDNMALVYASDSLGANIAVDNNVLENGSWAISLIGDTLANNWHFNDNYIHGHYAKGIAIDNVSSVQVNSNNIMADSNSTFASYNGIELTNNRGSAQIVGNKLLTLATEYAYGISVENCVFDSLNSALIANNFVQIFGNSTSTSLSAGILVYQTANVDVYFNTVRMMGTQNNACALSLYDLTAGITKHVNVTDNILTDDAGGYIYYIRNVDTADFSNSYNDLYDFNNSQNFAYLGTNISSYTAWITATAAVGCDTIDPYFASSTDLHVANNLLNGRAIPIAGITTDIDGDIRNVTTPDFGADEFIPSPWDIASLEVLSPIGSCGLTTNEVVTVRYKNIGSVAINGGLLVSYQLFGSAAVTETAADTIQPGDTLDYSFTATVNMDVSALGADSTYEIKAWADLTGDNVQQNDTTSKFVYSGYVPGVPTVEGDTIQYANSALIKAFGNTTYFWANDTTDTYLAQDSIYITPLLYDTTTYWASDRAGSGMHPMQCGTGTATSSHAPNYGFFNYSWSRILYTASELGYAGTIDSISFFVANTPSNYTFNDQKIYLGMINATSLPNNDYIDPSAMTKVFDGSITFNGSGIFTIVFTTPFSYDGLSSLIVQWENRDGSWASGYPTYVATNDPGKTAYKYADGSFSSIQSTGNAQTERPNMIAYINALGCFGQRVPVTVIVDSIPLHDVGVVRLLSPQSAIEMTNNESVDVMVKNFAYISKDTIPLAYQLDTMPLVRDTLFHHLAFGDSLQFDFSQKADFSAFGVHNLKVFTDLSYDVNPYDDTLNAQITNSMLLYCADSATSTGYEEIVNVSLANLNNTSAPSGARYSNFTNTVSPVVLRPGSTYPISVSSDFAPGYSYAYSTWINVFIDYNRDGVFDPSTELVFTSASNSHNTVSGNITVPTTGFVNAKPLRMRVAMRESGSQGNTGPCGTFTWGEVEDYNVVVANPIPNDAGIVGITPNQIVLTSSPVNLAANIQNMGTDSLVKVSVGWQIDTVVQTPALWTGLLYSDSIANNVAMGNYTFTNGPHTIKAWTSMPNDSIDHYAFNDTLKVNVYGCNAVLNGTYTVGTPSSDFPTFDEAINTIKHCGISGDVVFNIASGTYTTQLMIDSLPGVSANATVTFQSATANASDVIITFASTGSVDNYVVELNSADYINLNNISIEATGSSYGRALVFSGQNNNINITNCIIKAPTATTAYYTAAIYSGGSADTYISFLNNTIKNGYYAIYWRGSGTSDRDFASKFSNNTVSGFYYYGVYLYYQDSLVFENNTITSNPALNASSNYGLYNYQCNNSYRVTGNTINVVAATSTAYGMYLNYAQAADTARGLVANNMISCSSNGTQYGIYTYYVKYTDIVYNSVNVYGAAGTSKALYQRYGAGLRFLNNIFSDVSGHGYAAYFKNINAIDTTNYNDYYSTDTSLVYWNVNRATLADLQLANGMDTNSISTNPYFYSTTNLHALSPQLVGAATPISNVTIDIDGQLRNTTAPVIGADEFVPLATDIAVVSLVSPLNNVCYGTNETVEVKLTNVGANAIDFAVDTLHLHVNTTGAVTFAFPVVNINAGTLAIGADTNIIVSTAYDMSLPGTYTFNAYSSIVADSNHLNDTLVPVSMDVTPIVRTFPFMEDFSSFTPGNPGALANGWTRSNSVFKWQPNTGSTPSSSTGPIGDHTTGAGIYMYTEASGPSTGDVATLSSPCLDLSHFTNPVLKFWYHMYGASIHGLYVKAMDANNNWVTIDSIMGQQQMASSDPWLQRIVNLGQFTSGITKVQFYVARGNSYTGDVAIDDIDINQPSQWDIGVKELIMPEKNFAVAGTIIDTVMLRVQNFGFDTIFPTTGAMVNYQYAGQSPQTIAITDTILPYQGDTISILVPFSVIAGNKSLNAFTTLATDTITNNDTLYSMFMGVGVEALTYTNNFDGNQDFFIGNNSCWQRGIPNGANINTAYSSPNVWMTDLNSGYPDNTLSYLYTQFFDFTSVQAGDSATLSFYHWIDVSSSDGGYIEYSTDAGATWSLLGSVSTPSSEATNWYNSTSGGMDKWNATSTGWQYSSIKLGQFTGTASPVQFRFAFTSNSSSNSLDGWAIDNFAITLPRVANDVGFSSVVTPSVSSQIGASITVKGTVKNYGLNAQSAFQVKYIVNGNSVIESFTASGAGLLPDSTQQFSFTTPLVGPVSDYRICLVTNLNGDPYAQNDTACADITVTPANIDAGVTKVVAIPAWADTTKYTFPDSVHIMIVNFGLNTITSVPVQYSINGVVRGNGTWTGSLAHGDSAEYVFTMTYQSPIGNYNLCAKALLANDANPTNDQACHSYYGMYDVGINNANGLVFSVDQNEPNPAHGKTYVDYIIPQNAKVKFELRNALGQIIISQEEDKQSGNNRIEINANKLTNGIYYYTIQYHNKRITRRMLVNK